MRWRRVHNGGVGIDLFEGEMRIIPQTKKKKKFVSKKVHLSINPQVRTACVFTRKLKGVVKQQQQQQQYVDGLLVVAVMCRKYAIVHASIHTTAV